MVIVVGHNLAIDGDEEGPSRLVVLSRVEDGLEGIVQHVRVIGGTCAGPTSRALSGRNPAGFKDSCLKKKNDIKNNSISLQVSLANRGGYVP